MVGKIAQELVRRRAIEFGSFTLASGKKSDFYIDIKSAVTSPEFLSLIAKKVAKDFSFDIVAGVAVGGVPLAVAVSLESKKPYAIIRSSEKDHGKKNVIIGNVEGRSVLLIEDVTTSGASALYGVGMLRSAGAVVATVVTVVDREEGAGEMLKAHDVRLIPLATVSELRQG
ncbi:MAG TPA: orotate phosphoribosyltransferase [Methanoregulaceae archaeon]|nr:orotate phosphoribosyltransferase [Methanoregulaceae archaeon]HPD76029.1 orotate phosphoribosyltransferase [Methanoregulaceae archaeon]